MSELKLLLFEDQYDSSENILLISALAKEVPGICVEIAKNVREFEEKATKQKFDMIILDIMAEPMGLINDGGRRVTPGLTGLALLENCRTGRYRRDYTVKDFPIFVRTTRGEPAIHKTSLRKGATGFFLSYDDTQLINRIKKHVLEVGPKENV